MALEFAHGALHWGSANTVGTNITVSGLSFQPKALRFYWSGLMSTANTDTTSQTQSIDRGVGFANSTLARRTVSSYSQDGAGTANCATEAANDGIVYRVDGQGTTIGALDITAINSDGFTTTVDVQSANNLTVFWEAWGGSDITDVTVGDFAEPAATGTQNYTANGFTSGAFDQIVMFAGVQSINALNTGYAEASGLTIGYGSANQSVHIIGNSDDASATMDTDSTCHTGACLGMIAPAGGVPTARANLTAFGANTFTLDWQIRATTNRKYIYMAIKGGQWAVDSTTINGSSLNATATVSGLPFQPKGICFLGTNSAAGNTANDKMSVGTATSTSSRRSVGSFDEDANTTSIITLSLDYDSVLNYTNRTASVVTSIDLNAINSDGFQLIVDAAGGVASEWVGYMTFADAPIVTTRRFLIT